MGMTPAEFWDMPPYLFFRKVDGHFQRENRHDVYFRESYALLYNINRGEKNPAIEGSEVIQLPGEKKKRQYQPRFSKNSSMSNPAERARVTLLFNGFATYPPPWKPADRDFTTEELQVICNGEWREFPFYLAWKAAQEAGQTAPKTDLNQPA